jgi:hypothetical protein
MAQFFPRYLATHTSQVAALQIPPKRKKTCAIMSASIIKFAVRNPFQKRLICPQ